MPKLPKGMFRRGSSFYTRLRGAGRDRWISLGGNYEEACRKLRALRHSESPLVGRKTVADAAQRWLDSYVVTARNEKGRKLAAARARQLLVPFLGHRLLDKVSSEDLRAYRIWLEKQGIRKLLSPQTVAHVLSDARCFFNWCEDAGLVGKSPELAPVQGTGCISAVHLNESVNSDFAVAEKSGVHRKRIDFAVMDPPSCVSRRK